MINSTCCCYGHFCFPLTHHNFQDWCIENLCNPRFWSDYYFFFALELKCTPHTNYCLQLSCRLKGFGSLLWFRVKGNCPLSSAKWQPFSWTWIATLPPCRRRSGPFRSIPDNGKFLSRKDAAMWHEVRRFQAISSSDYPAAYSFLIACCVSKINLFYNSCSTDIGVYVLHIKLKVLSGPCGVLDGRDSISNFY